MIFRCRHRRAKILHAYPETEADPIDYWTCDGQRIPAATYLCKLSCPCGRVWLGDVLLGRLLHGTPDSE